MKSQQQNVKMNDFILDFSSKLNDQKKETKSIEKDLKGIEKIMERDSEGSNRKGVFGSKRIQEKTAQQFH